MSSRFKEMLNDVRGGAAGGPEHEHAASAWHDGPPPGPGPLRNALPGLVIGIAALLVTLGVVGSSVSSAQRRLTRPGQDERPAVATAQEAEVAYCTTDFKQVLERV